MSDSRLKPQFIFHADYKPPEDTVVHIIKADYGKIGPLTIQAGAMAVENLKRACRLGKNVFILLSVNLGDQPYHYPQAADALKQEIESRTLGIPVILFTHTNNAGDIYQSLVQKGCAIGDIIELPADKSPLSPVPNYNDNRALDRQFGSEPVRPAVARALAQR